MPVTPRHPYLDIPHVGETLGPTVPMGGGMGSFVRFPTGLPRHIIQEMAKEAAAHAKAGGGSSVPGRPLKDLAQIYPKPFISRIDTSPNVNLPGVAGEIGASPRTVNAWNSIVSDPASRERFWALMRMLFFRPPWSPQ